MGLKIQGREFRGHGNSLMYSMVPWDSEIFGFAVVEAWDVRMGDAGSFDGFISDFERSIMGLDGRMICIKVPPEAREAFDRLQANGYGFIEETIKPYKPDLQNTDVDYRKYMKYPLRSADAGDIEIIRGIALRTFALDRFHRDRRFSGDKASERYSYWINNSYHSGEDVLVLDADGVILGFAVVGFTGDDAYIGLIGVDDACKGRGWGTNLLAATCQYAKNKGAKELSTTVSLNNIPALNLYSKYGFKFRDPVYVLHKWM